MTRPYRTFSRHSVALLIAAGTLLFLVLLWSLYTTNAKNRDTDNPEMPGTGATCNDTALFLAAGEVPTSSPLYELTLHKQYLAYKEQIDRCWSMVQEPNREKIESWKKDHMPARSGAKVLYPFSGPDMLNALIFFPSAEEYILFGLEAPGQIPSLTGKSPDRIIAGLKELRDVLNTMIWVNFFKTNDMRKDIGTSEYDSTSSVIMWFIAREHYNLENVKKIWIGLSGKLTDKQPADGGLNSVPGVEFRFSDNKGRKKRARYFQVDVSDQSVSFNTLFVPFLKSQGRFSTMIKSASYLMFYQGRFDSIRSVILAQSDVIIQDDSGIPYRYFTRDTWELSLHGIYIKPIAKFGSMFQADFKESMNRLSTGPLPFSYGYHYKQNESNLMIAEKIRQ
ncbi:MAG TPA: hypothetical protein PK926_12130 [Spirochaetota bacterium]|nr:hypothetical protein [Spirochaetota bacterium]HPI88260.1 hypothetical protein [Spirochaetota bacterium]HPR47196.1 hypothetical protein [Spirochaetota bacterium]